MFSLTISVNIHDMYGTICGFGVHLIRALMCCFFTKMSLDYTVFLLFSYINGLCCV